jgi:hypothetical protein
MDNKILITFVGALIGGFLISYISKVAPKHPAPTSDNAMSRYGKSKLLTIASAFVMTAWFSIIASFVVLCLGSTGVINENTSMFVYSAIVLLTTSFCYIAICPFLKCESCGRLLTLQWTESPPFAKRKWGIGGWAWVILGVLFTRRFRCMYCGKHYFVT